MKLGVFSVSLAVKDLAASRTFYETLGFAAMGGEPEQNWLILRNPDGVAIGLFEGMFEGDLMTVSPGWDRDAQPLDSFEDVRDIQAKLKAAGLALTHETEAEGTGPASLMLADPDGNAILIDQHAPRQKGKGG